MARTGKTGRALLRGKKKGTKKPVRTAGRRKTTSARQVAVKRGGRSATARAA